MSKESKPIVGIKALVPHNHALIWPGAVVGKVFARAWQTKNKQIANADTVDQAQGYYQAWLEE